MRNTDFPEVISIQWLREKYCSKEISPEEVIAEIIKRAQADRSMNIWIEMPDMKWIKPYLTGLMALNPALPLWGIPFAVKDNMDVAGIPTTAGCNAYTYIPREHATVVQRLVAAGAIPVGKTNLDQFATGLVGTRSPYGETHNALCPELISGGSSSGSAVAVARGQAVFALGTDTAGSGRVPAALNNLVGFKSSLGAWPTRGVVPACASLDCVTVFSHCLDDALTVDRVVRGFDESDPWSRRLPEILPALPHKICLPKNPLNFFGPYAREYQSAWQAVVKRLQAGRIPVEYIDERLFQEAAAILYDGPWVAERWADLSGFIENHPGAAFPVTEQILRSGAAEKHTAAAVFKAMHQLQQMKAQTRRLLQNAVLVMPTAGGTWTREEVRLDPIRTNSAMGQFTNHCNLLDLCAVAVPGGFAAANVPFGITLFGLADSENLICGAAKLMINACTGTVRQDSIVPEAKKSTTPVAVCGLHMRGFPLEQQMLAFGARFQREALTAAKYQLVKLPTTPPKPGLIKKQCGGAAIRLEIWEMPMETLGPFVASIPAPLGFGKIELQDGTEVPGFICEAYAGGGATDITAAGGWRNS